MTEAEGERVRTNWVRPILLSSQVAALYVTLLFLGYYVLECVVNCVCNLRYIFRVSNIEKN